MIYTVECGYIDPASEAEWNDFYSRDKLPALVSVGGFHTSQRFKAMSGAGPTYLALHSIDNPEVLQGDDYRQKGGGNFARWQPHISDWRRNLYRGLDRAPAVHAGEYLAISHVGPEPLARMGLVPHRMQAIGLDRCPGERWLAILTSHAARGRDEVPNGVHLYAPMTSQLTSATP